jgi:hypothetical protein
MNLHRLAKGLGKVGVGQIGISRSEDRLPIALDPRAAIGCVEVMARWDPLDVASEGVAARDGECVAKRISQSRQAALRPREAPAQEGLQRR